MDEILILSSNPIKGSECPLFVTDLVPFLPFFSAASGTQLRSSSPAPPPK